MNPSYKGFYFTVEPVQPATEILIAELGELGFESFVETETGLQAFIIAEDFQENMLDEVQILTSEEFEITYTSEDIEQVNWNEEWEKNYFQPLLINDQVLIRAPFHQNYPQAKYQIIIEPNMAFGTGNHETTTLMLEHLSDIPLDGQLVLDMGCGTGILGIYAAMLGANKITAIDIDSWSFEATVENSRLNGITNLEAFIGDAELLEQKKFDIILANIQKNIILQDVEKYVLALKEEGLLILSGFYKEDSEAIIGKASELLLKKMEIKEKNNWVAISFQK